MNEKNLDKFDALLRHTLNHSAIPQPPPNFARDLAQRTAGVPEQANVETWIGGLAVAIAAVAASVLMLSQAWAGIRKVLELLDGAPWPLLLTAAIVFSGIKLFEVARRAGKGYVDHF